METISQLLNENEFLLLKQGNSAVFRKVYDAYFGLIHYVATRCGLSSAEARDVVQDTFIKLYEKANELQRVDTLKAWLVTIARNRSLDLLRQRKAEQKKHNRQQQEIGNIDEVEDDSLHSLWHELQVILLKDLINEVCVQSGEDSFKLFYVDGLSARDIAEKKNESISTVTNRLSRLRSRFRDSFKHHLENMQEPTK